MTYYRVAWKRDDDDQWVWKSTKLSSQEAVFLFLRMYRASLGTRVHVFSASSLEELDVLLAQENQQNNASHERTQPANNYEPRKEQNALADAVSILDRRRLEMEQGPGGDHDTPYVYSLPISLPQRLAWLYILGKVQLGELVP